MGSIQLNSLRQREAATDPKTTDEQNTQSDSAEWLFPEGGADAWQCLLHHLL